MIATIFFQQWDCSVEASIAHERKTALLDALEAQWRAEHEASDAGYYATSYSSWLSYGTGLLANIVENLQVALKEHNDRYLVMISQFLTPSLSRRAKKRSGGSSREKMWR